MIRRLRDDEAGSVLITALLVTVVMLGLGFALLSIVDTQASESATERSRDRAFNLSESVLTSQAFVLGRNWPGSTSAPVGDPDCSTTTFGDPLGAAAATSPASARVKRNLDESYDPDVDSAYTGATWQVNLCDDVDADGAGPLAGSTVWSDSLLTNSSVDLNGNDKLWVRAESSVEGKKSIVVGLVRARTTPALNSRYALVSGGMADDLGSALNTLTNQSVLAKVVGAGGIGLLDTTPTVAPDPTPGAATPNGITGVRCGALDLKDGSTCITGTIAATGAIPLVSDLVTGGTIENVPGTTSASEDAIARLRAQARDAGTYTAVSAGTVPVTSASVLNPNDTAPASVAACTLTGAPGASSVVFIEQVGSSGVSGTVGGPGDQYCSIDVSTAKQYKAIVIGSGRVVIRGNNTTTDDSVTTQNTFKGVVYALNLQRHAVADGGRGLGDAAAPGREVVRIDRGAHVRGSVNADGKSAKVGVYPPPITINTASLVTSLLGSGVVATTLNGLLGTLGVSGTIDALVSGQCLVTLPVLGCTVSLGGLGVTNVANGILNQVGSQRTNYGSAITSDVAAINALTIYGASNVIPGSFRDLQAK